MLLATESVDPQMCTRVAGAAAGRRRAAAVVVTAAAGAALLCCSTLRAAESAANAAAAARRAQGTAAICEENGRWQNLPWVYLTYAERKAWGELGWSETWWDRAWEANSAAVSASGRCFGGKYLIGESGEDTCLVGSLVTSYADCKNASAEYQLSYPGNLFELGAAVDDLQGTPGCSTQDRVGFMFNVAQITGPNVGYTPICKFDPEAFGGGCPQTTTSSTTTLPAGVDGSAIPAAVTTCYQDLSEEQQDAVRLLGYTISTWHSCMRPDWHAPTCTWPPNIPTPDAPCLDQLDYLNKQYNTSKPWGQLTSRVRDALITLGWDEAGNMWRAMDYPETYAKPFSGQNPPTGLSFKEQQAASFLGYAADTWARCKASECLTRFARLETLMKTWTWRTSMPAGVRRNLETLGWSEDSWYEGQPPAVYQSAWADLLFPQRVSATLLGYTEDMWGGCEQSACVVRYQYVLAKYKNLKWSDMNSAQQNAWRLLGHSPELWDSGGMMRTSMFSRRWDELTPEQQRQAKFLGESAGTWQGCTMDWGTGSTNTTVDPVIQGGPLRTVRSEMTIDSPFSEISGNVYGAQVATLPISFIELFQRAIARALFCGNPDYKEYPDGARDAAGNALCMLPDEYERQKQRIRVVSVREGSIIVDFIIVANQTTNELTAEFLFEALVRQLASDYSPIGQDIEFGRFARKAVAKEVPLSTLSTSEREAALEFESMRAAWNSGNACALSVDARKGLLRCPTDGTKSVGGSLLGFGFFGRSALTLLGVVAAGVPARCC